MKIHFKVAKLWEKTKQTPFCDTHCRNYTDQPKFNNRLYCFISFAHSEK